MLTTDIDSDEFLLDAADRLHNPLPDPLGPLRVGIDLGTATIVIAVVDALDRPVYLDFRPASAVRDGVVVDFHAAAAATKELKATAESALGVALPAAATAYPPGVDVADSRACGFVLERAGFACVGLTDEVSAAAALLNVREGAIADVGGGSTGVGVWVAGERVALGDTPGGGHHLNLILAGAHGISVEDAERTKREGRSDHLPVLRPGIERIAHNIGRLMPTSPTGPIHLVGGALMVPGAGGVVARYLGHDVIEHPHALLVTPFGIALSVADGTSGAW